MIVSDSLADLQRKFDAWKSGMEDKGLRVNIGKTKLMVNGPNLNRFMTLANTHAGYADRVLVETRYFVRAVRTGCTGDVQAGQGELGKTLHLGAIDV